MNELDFVFGGFLFFSLQLSLLCTSPSFVLGSSWTSKMSASWMCACSSCLFFSSVSVLLLWSVNVVTGCLWAVGRYHVCSRYWSLCLKVSWGLLFWRPPLLLDTELTQLPFLPFLWICSTVLTWKTWADTWTGLDGDLFWKFPYKESSAKRRKSPGSHRCLSADRNYS